MVYYFNIVPLTHINNSNSIMSQEAKPKQPLHTIQTPTYWSKDNHQRNEKKENIIKKADNARNKYILPTIKLMHLLFIYYLMHYILYYFKNFTLLLLLLLLILQLLFLALHIIILHTNLLYFNTIY